MQLFIATLLIVAKIEKHPRYLSKLVDKLWSIETMKYYSALK